MKILAVCQHYWPETFQVTRVCEGLAARGHEVTALVGVPNYPDGVVPLDYRRGLNRRQRRNRVNIIRAREVPRGKGALRLAVNYHSFSESAKRIARRLPGDFDIVYAHQLSPVMMAEPAVAYARKHDKPMLLYCADLWPESMKVMLGERLGALVALYGRVSRKVYGAADLVVGQSPAFAEYFERVHGLPREKLAYLPQFSTASGEPAPAREHEGVNFMMTGNVGRAQDVPVALEAVSRMRHRSGFRLHVVGGGSLLSEMERLASSMGLGGRVAFHGRRPAGEMAEFNAVADAFVLTLNGDTWVGATVPSRLQGYMAAGRPVLAAVNGGSASVIEDSGCGRSVPAGDAGGLAGLMDSFMDDPGAYAGCGERGRRYFEEEFSEARHVEALEGMLSGLIGEVRR